MKRYDVKQSWAGGWLGVCLAFLLAACSDDFHLTAEVTQPGEPLLEQDLQPYGYTLPLQITTNGDWRIELDEAGEKIAYACPEQGTGDAVVKICILDNLDETARSGQLPREAIRTLTPASWDSSVWGWAMASMWEKA